jgi:hypothetical protein
VDCDGSSSLQHPPRPSSYGYVTRPPSSGCNDHVILFMGLKNLYILLQLGEPSSSCQIGHAVSCTSPTLHFLSYKRIQLRRTDESVLRSQKPTVCDLAHARRTVVDLPNGHHSQSLAVVTVDKRGDLRYITNIHIAFNYTCALLRACTRVHVLEPSGVTTAGSYTVLL